METDKLDKLFKEKSGDYRISPNEDTWSRISEKMGKRKSVFPWIRVAAVILLTLGLSWFVIPFENKPETQPSKMILADHPKYVPEIIPGWNIPANENKKVKNIQIENKTGTLTRESSRPQNTKLNDDLPEPELLQSLRIVNIDYSTPVIPENLLLTSGERERVIIKYYADATDKSTPASSSKIKQLITYASNKTPAEILGDIREAKNEFIDSKLSLD